MPPRTSTTSFGSSFGSSFGAAAAPAAGAGAAARVPAPAPAPVAAPAAALKGEEKPKLMSFGDLGAVSGWDGQAVHDETVSTAGGDHTVDDDDEDEEEEEVRIRSLHLPLSNPCLIPS